ncbi:hypothetical protein C2E20_3906 [Micractinium conductrix]|uniref:Uncharacterized protein n=1 Tax=Micractinium conductrix TaxID=554055 RepID=A0A2P6VFA4_9CHLO|nr:hypothetical protein C2E20_3906 [Micractinium conductrix]|eukprot:PSC72775.1 hypothetical protein C2E20_3906 [Micractinium conductrix]
MQPGRRHTPPPLPQAAGSFAVRPLLAGLLDKVALLACVAAGEPGALDMLQQVLAAAGLGSSPARRAVFLAKGYGFQADAASAATAATAATAAAARDPLASKQQSYLRRGACQLLRASHPPAIGTALHTFGPGFARWVKWASLRLYEVPYGEDVPLWAALRQVSRIRDAGVRDSAASEAAIEDADVVLRLELGECGKLGFKSVIPTAEEVVAKAEHDPGSLSLVLDHVRASLLLALGRPGAAGDFNAPEKILPCFRLLNDAAPWLAAGARPCRFCRAREREHFFCVHAEQLEAAFSRFHPGRRLSGPCTGCERCGTGAVAVAESVATSFTAQVALALRREFAPARVSLPALAKWGPPGRPIDDVGIPFPSPRSTLAPRRRRFVGSLSGRQHLADESDEEEDSDEEVGEGEAEDEQAPFAHPPTPPAVPVPAPPAPQPAEQQPAEPVQLQAFAAVAVRAVSAALAAYDCPTSDPRHGATLCLCTWEAICRLYRVGALSDKQQSRVRSLLCEAAAAVLPVPAGQAPIQGEALERRLAEVQDAEAAAVQRDWQQRQAAEAGEQQQQQQQAGSSGGAWGGGAAAAAAAGSSGGG